MLDSKNLSHRPILRRRGDPKLPEIDGGELRRGHDDACRQHRRRGMSGLRRDPGLRQQPPDRSYVRIASRSSSGERRRAIVTEASRPPASPALGDTDRATVPAKVRSQARS